MRRKIIIATMCLAGGIVLSIAGYLGQVSQGMTFGMFAQVIHPEAPLASQIYSIMLIGGIVLILISLFLFIFALSNPKTHHR